MTEHGHHFSASRLIVAFLVAPVRAYQLVVSPLLGPRCRFYPSCSAYAVDALRAHGPVRGGWLAVRRLARCHPWNPGGVDPVPGPGHSQVVHQTEGLGRSDRPDPAADVQPLEHSAVTAR